MLALLLAVPLLVFHGNVGLVDDVYRTVLDLPAGTKATPATARAVASRLQKFLHDSGYVLGTVRARAEGDQIVVDVDEGRLDKIIFLGGGAFETLRLRLELSLRDDIFNKPELERQLRALGRRLGLGEFAYEVVPVPHVGSPGLLNLEPTGQPPGPAGLGRPYELHVLVRPGAFRPGISPELEVDSLDTIAARIVDFLEMKVPQNMLGKLKMLPKLAEVGSFFPKIVNRGPCQEVVRTDGFSLADYPILQCWPEDGGRFITLPLVFSRNPLTGKRNCGCYRMQVYDDRSTGMHWQTHKHGAEHYRRLLKEGKTARMDVAVAIGSDPATMYSAMSNVARARRSTAGSSGTGRTQCDPSARRPASSRTWGRAKILAP